MNKATITKLGAKARSSTRLFQLPPKYEKKILQDKYLSLFWKCDVKEGVKR